MMMVLFSIFPIIMLYISFSALKNQEYMISVIYLMVGAVPIYVCYFLIKHKLFKNILDNKKEIKDYISKNQSTINLINEQLRNHEIMRCESLYITERLLINIAPESLGGIFLYRNKVQIMEIQKIKAYRGKVYSLTFYGSGVISIKIVRKSSMRKIISFFKINQPNIVINNHCKKQW